MSANDRWSCRSCTFINQGKDVYCLMCTTPNGKIINQQGKRSSLCKDCGGLLSKYSNRC